MEVHVADAHGDLVTLSEIAVRFLVQLPVRAHHPQVVVGDRAPVLVAGAAVRFEGALVPREGFVQLALDVREDPQVLLHARPQRAALPPDLQGAEEVQPGFLEGAGFEVQHAQCVERLRREQIVADLSRHLVAPPAQLAGLRGIVPLVADDGQAPQGLRQHGVLAVLLRRGDRGLVARNRFGDTAGPLPTPRVVEQVRSTAARSRGRRTAGIAE